MADQEIKTSIDGLVVYLNEHGETNTVMIATALGVGEQTIIEWANILEKANAIKIIHKSGRMFLSPLSGSNAGPAIQGAAKKSMDESEQLNIQAEIASQIAAVNQVDAKLDQFNRSFAEIDALFRAKYKNVKPLLDKVNAIQNQVDGFEKKMSTKSKQIEDLQQKMQKDFDALQKYSSVLSSFNVDTNSARGVSDDIKGRVLSYQSNMEEMTKTLDKIIYTYRKNALETQREMRDRVDQLRQILNLEEKQIREYERTASDYKRESNLMIKDAEQRRKVAIDEAGKIVEEVRRLRESSGNEIKSLKGSIDELKKSLGNVSSLNDNLFALRKELDSMTSQRDSIMKALSAMQQEIKAVSTKKADEKQSVINRANVQSKKTMEGVDKLKQSADKFKKDFEKVGSDSSAESKIQKSGTENSKDGMNG